jgi:hypothetical protein
MVSPVAQQMIAEGGIHSSRVDMAPAPGTAGPGRHEIHSGGSRSDRGTITRLKARFAEIFQ